MSTFRKEDCANCKIRTDFPEKMLKNRKRVVDTQMRIAIFVNNKAAYNMNDYVCKNCYKFLNCVQEIDDHVELQEQFHDNVEPIQSILLFDTISDYRCRSLTGIHLEQLNELVSQFEDVHPPVRISVKNCIGFYLMKFHMGISTRELGQLYDEPSERQAKSLIIFVRELLYNSFTPRNLGVQVITRDRILSNHTTTKAKILLDAKDDSIISIWDATYIYIEKSSNYEFQRSTYSMHKHRPLLKFMILVATDGHIIDVVGPYISNGHNNDASITQDIFTRNLNEICDFFEEDDLFVVDRGFRDSLDFMDGKKFCFNFLFILFFCNKKIL